MQKTIIRQLIENVTSNGNYTEMCNENFILEWEEKDRKQQKIAFENGRIRGADEFSCIDTGQSPTVPDFKTFYNTTFKTINNG